MRWHVSKCFYRAIAAILFWGMLLNAHPGAAQAMAGGDVFHAMTATTYTIVKQNRAVADADLFAAGLAERGTAEYVRLVKNALSLEPGVFSFVAQSTPSKLDEDDRYRQNFLDLVALRNPSPTFEDQENRIWSGLPTRGYLNTVAVHLKSHLCTGIVISMDTVLTAAHCVCDETVQEIDVGYFADSDLNTKFGKKSIALVEPMRKCDQPKSTAADVAIIKIFGTFDAKVKPATFASTDTINDSTLIRAVGFGSTRTGQTGQKLYVDIPMTSRNCKGSVTLRSGTLLKDSQWYGCYENFELVAGQPHLDKDMCYGDSGGPIFFHADDGNGSYDEFLVAITSRKVGIPKARACGDGGIYERVDGAVLEWLMTEKKVGILLEGQNRR